MRVAAIIAFILFIPGVGFAENAYFVPGSCRSIQEALDKASSGDLVIVRPGTYYENIDFLGKSIRLQSDIGPEFTIIDGCQAGSVVTFSAGDGQLPVLEGFTITNGSGTPGQHNPATTYGGGIYCEADICPTITGNIITGNTGVTFGGGIFIHFCAPLITANVIANNQAGDGGGVYFIGPAGGGKAGSPGKRGIYAPLIADNVIRDNTATARRGGGVLCHGHSHLVANNLIFGNHAAVAGGGIECYSALNIVNNTVSGNSAGIAGGGISSGGGAFVQITNTILWNNTAPQGKEILVGGGTFPCEIHMEHSDCTGGSSSIHIDAGGTFRLLHGNISTDPGFVDAADNDFHITLGSPCRDAGTINAYGLQAADFEGDPRLAGTRVDIGADEFCQHIYHSGTAVPGSSIDLRVAGPPGSPVMLIHGMPREPLTTSFGELCLDIPPIRCCSIGTIPANGILTRSATVPLWWIPGERQYFQALVGPFGQPSTRLTNLMVLPVK